MTENIDNPFGNVNPFSLTGPALHFTMLSCSCDVWNSNIMSSIYYQSTPPVVNYIEDIWWHCFQHSVSFQKKINNFGIQYETKDHATSLLFMYVVWYLGNVDCVLYPSDLKKSRTKDLNRWLTQPRVDNENFGNDLRPEAGCIISPPSWQ